MLEETPNLQDVSACYAGFSFKLFKAIVQQEQDKNVVVSPVSVAIALAMIYNGADGDTRAAMAQVLELEALDLDQINTANAALLAALNRLDPQINLTIANKLEVSESVSRSIKSTFIQSISKFYQPEMVESATLSAIQLANTTYFKGTWTDPFSSLWTKERPFTLPNGDQQSCSMMTLWKQEWAYYQHDQFQLVKLPYGARHVSMLVLLPGINISLSESLHELTLQSWREWLNLLADKEGRVDLPRFEIDYRIELKHVLTGLGMGDAFDPSQANFAALSPLSTFIDQVYHQARIEVDEKGTEASALTFGAMSILGIDETEPTEKPFHMVMDRPFFYVIRDDVTGMPLFLGQTVDPAS